VFVNRNKTETDLQTNPLCSGRKENRPVDEAGASIRFVGWAAGKGRDKHARCGSKSIHPRLM
jgi:hypothetical protein